MMYSMLLWISLPILSVLGITLFETFLDHRDKFETTKPRSGSPSELIDSVLTTMPQSHKGKCMICKDSFTRPKRTPCKHTFCDICIRTTLAQRNECPYCQRVLFRSGASTPDTWRDFSLGMSAILELVLFALWMGQRLFDTPDHPLILVAVKALLVAATYAFVYGFSAIYLLGDYTATFCEFRERLPYLVIGFSSFLAPVDLQTFHTVHWTVFLLTWTPFGVALGAAWVVTGLERHHVL